MARPKRGEKTFKVFVTLSEEEFQKLEEMRVRLGLEERSSLVRMAIREFLQKLYQRDILEVLREKIQNEKK